MFLPLWGKGVAEMRKKYVRGFTLVVLLAVIAIIAILAAALIPNLTGAGSASGSTGYTFTVQHRNVSVLVTESGIR